MTTYLGKSCSFCLPRVPFVNCRQFMYLVISLLVLRAGYGIWLYQFLIIAYLFTFMWCGSITYDHCFYWCTLAIRGKFTPCHSPFRGITTKLSCVHIFQIFSVCQLCHTFMELISGHQYHYWQFGISGLTCWPESKEKKYIKKLKA